MLSDLADSHDIIWHHTARDDNPDLLLPPECPKLGRSWSRYVVTSKPFAPLDVCGTGENASPLLTFHPGRSRECRMTPRSGEVWWRWWWWVRTYLRARADVFQEPVPKYNLACLPPPPPPPPSPNCPEVGNSALITVHKIRLALLSADWLFLCPSRCRWDGKKNERGYNKFLVIFLYIHIHSNFTLMLRHTFHIKVSIFSPVISHNL